MTRIAIVGMACRYPDAASPRELWENVVAGRRAFRQLPDVRMNLNDYWDADPATPDKFYARNAAVIEGYEFDRVAYKVAGSTYRSTDLTHWLALDTAALALADAGFPMAEGLQKERTSVIVGNTLTGEFSRANQMRLRWPYVRRMVAGALKEQGWDDDQLSTFLDGFEATYKAPFPAVDEDTLAGGLSNTIAGRICNHFDLKGGGYTVDGACSSSLLSVATAGKALIDGDADVAVAGGVDISIDPFEIIGFAKTGALATGEMRIYDRGSNGFWPGEGCGMVVLMREADARAAGHRIYATIAGWGISSDGKGGITRPEVSGYQLALRRAYERAGFGIESVALFEGHGTGTQVGDATELKALSLARRAADPRAPKAAIGSIKAMIGHTKAAAGVAGLIKAAMAVHNQVIPPTVGCFDPHEELTSENASLRVLRKAEQWPEDMPVRAAVTAMGFGGINTHIVMETATNARRRGPLDARTFMLAASAQDAEILLIDAGTVNELKDRLIQLVDFVPALAYSQIADLASTLQRELTDRPYRAAVIATSPDDAVKGLRFALEQVEAGVMHLIDTKRRVYIGKASGPAQLGFLFPGQGSGRGISGGALRRRFSEVDEVYTRAALPTGTDIVATAVAQPRIVTGSMAGLRALASLGLDANVAVGHSLGEISALHWAGVMDEEALLRVAALRGQTMTEFSESGTMAGVAEGPEVLERLLAKETEIVIAGHNGPKQTVIAGPVDAITRFCQKLGEAGIVWARLPVSHAFHSPLVAPAAQEFADRISEESFGQVGQRIVSTVTGDLLDLNTDIVELLRNQITQPVLFDEAVKQAAADIDLFVEVGPGQVLTRMVPDITDTPVVAMDTDNESLVSLFGVVGAAYVVGAPVAHGALFQGRLTRSLNVGAEFKFFASPCEEAPQLDLASVARPAEAASVAATAATRTEEATADRLRRLAAQRAELPLELVRMDSLLLDDLHLSSITVGQIVNQAVREMGLPVAQAPTNFATATVGELAAALDALDETALPADNMAEVIAGSEAWSRAFALEFDAVPMGSRVAGDSNGTWKAFAPARAEMAETLLARNLRLKLEQSSVGSGVLVWMPPHPVVEDLETVLTAAREALAQGPGGRFAIVQNGRGAAGLAKTLRLEAPGIRTTIVHLPEAGLSTDVLAAEVAATSGFSEAYYDESGTRTVPVLRAMPVTATDPENPLGPEDVLLVTGGGKGITAEAALAVAGDTGAKLAIMGRSDAAQDAELMANLDRMRAAGITVQYVRADVTDASRVAAAIAEVRSTLGPVTAVLHGAGRNEPAGLTSLDLAAFQKTFAPKIDGLRAVLAAIEPSELKLLVTFGSIIGRAGLRGEAHYATANEWLAALTKEFGEKNPDCRVVCMEWSVWSGVGMGERLSVVESLMREGIVPIPPDRGIEVLRRLVHDPATPPIVVIAGRSEGLDTIRFDEPELPLLRFVERPLVRYHGVELITEAELSSGSDPYLDDHLLDGNLLFPAVIGMEAMAQVAGATGGWTGPIVIENAEFSRPIVVPPAGATTIRIAATVIANKTLAMAIRSSESSYAVDHFRATVRFTDEPVPGGSPDPIVAGLPLVALDPSTQLYGSTMFQGKRFQRLLNFHRSSARHVDADLAVQDKQQWFSTILPGELLLGDPGMRDALMHGNQVCVPDATLLPAGIERVRPAGARLNGSTKVLFSAVEREQRGDTYIYDIAVRNDAGEVVERWDGLRLQAVRKTDGSGPWVAPILGSYLERNINTKIGADIAVVVEPDGHVTDRRKQTAIAVGRALGSPTKVRYRPDGKPEVSGGMHISAAHGSGVTLAVASKEKVACDVEPVQPRSDEDWSGLLGANLTLATLIAGETGESADTAGTRVWSAMECLQKAGAMVSTPLTLVPNTTGNSWVEFAAGKLRIASFVTTLENGNEQVAFAILAGGK